METTRLEAFFSSTWLAATSKSSEGLDSDDQETLEEFKSWEDIQSRLISDLSPSISLVQPALGHLREFIQFFESKLGPKLDASIIWGTLACLLQISSEDAAVQEKLPRMVKSLAHKAEAFNGICRHAPVISNNMKEACFDMQIQLLDFFSSSIKRIHDANEGGPYFGTPVQYIERRYATTNQELGEAVARVEKLIGINLVSQPRFPQARGADNTVSKCLMLPHTRLTRCFDRLDVFDDLDRVLGPATRDSPFRSVALYGLGGVDKSSVALSYMEARYKDNTYDICLWVRGEKTTSLRQSFTDIALRLKLPGAQQQTPDDNLILVQDWFQSTGRSWLLVYDNVESYETLMPYWPSSNKGRVIITTRNHSLAFEPCSEGVQVVSWDAMTGSQFLVWLLKKNIGRDLETENDSALILSERLSGHALAIQHMAGLIHRFRFSIHDFMTMYLKNPRALHQRGELQALFDFSFKSLDEDSNALLGVISYLMPDEIQQEVFRIKDNQQPPDELLFCADDFTFLDVLGKLAEMSLVNRDLDTKTLSTHRLIQTQFRYFLTAEQRQRSFNNAVALIADVFPSENPSNAQMYEVWQACNRYLQHVISLRDFFVEERKLTKTFKPNWRFCDLLRRCARYLLESFSLQDLEVTCTVNMAAVELLDSCLEREDLSGTILSHQAQMAECLGEGEKAVRLNKEEYDLRLLKPSQNRELLCYTSSNLGYCSNTANDHTAALEWFDKSREWWGSEAGFPPQILMNRARCLVYLGEYKEAKELLDTFFAQIGEAQTVSWAVLAYGYFVQGVLHKHQREFESAERYFIEAQNAWLKGNQTRNHPFNGGCMYNIAASCLGQGKVEAAIKHIRDSMKVTKFQEKNMPAEHARNLFKLSEALLQDGHHGSTEEAIALREEAEAILKRRDAHITDASTDDAYDRLISISWR
ncbi:pfs domain-containing protein [Apiosordaria backusii]|uniref:Pfs domain-containing protein n=1 Tax=Apiosordaria backusii TaxID=314023 RepID=A0AA40K667_9PEZI|nr:pfs domain-containing protein [Apiosordaria backusii]